MERFYKTADLFSEPHGIPFLTRISVS